MGDDAWDDHTHTHTHTFHTLKDQLRAMRALCDAAFGTQAPPIDVYDGDTPQAHRPSIRQRVQLLITNPDMLHMSILPVHQQFARFLTKLKYVVVDEGHAYRGVFGAHTAFVIRRLRRVCRHVYGSAPCFAVTSATVANPRAAVETLLGVNQFWGGGGPGDAVMMMMMGGDDHGGDGNNGGGNNGADSSNSIMHAHGQAMEKPLVVVDRDGSPHGAKQFVLWNPPLAEQVCTFSRGVCVVLYHCDLWVG